MNERFTIGEFAKAADVNVETIRYYQRKGLVREPAKPHGSVRRYGAADLARLRFIKTAQRLGFSLDEVAELARLDEGAHCVEVSRLAERKLAQIRERLAELERRERRLATLVDECHDRSGGAGCPLTASLRAGISERA